MKDSIKATHFRSRAQYRVLCEVWYFLRGLYLVFIFFVIFNYSIFARKLATKIYAFNRLVDNYGACFFGELKTLGLVKFNKYVCSNVSFQSIQP